MIALSHQVDESMQQRQIGDVTGPDVIGPIDRPVTQQIGIDPVRLAAGRQIDLRRG